MTATDVELARAASRGASLTGWLVVVGVAVGIVALLGIAGARVAEMDSPLASVRSVDCGTIREAADGSWVTVTWHPSDIDCQEQVRLALIESGLSGRQVRHAETTGATVRGDGVEVRWYDVAGTGERQAAVIIDE
jgi:hypothetical protein